MEIKELLQEKLRPEFTVMSIDNVNHKPHSYTIGPKHIAHASDNHGGMLGDATLKAIKCAHPNCQVSYDQHTSDRVAFLQLTGNLTQQQAQQKLQSVTDICKEHKIDGFTFVETPEQFRIS